MGEKGIEEVGGRNERVVGTNMIRIYLCIKLSKSK